MSEKRFTLEQWTEESLYFSDGEFSAHMSIGYICKKVEKKLNEQQDFIYQLQDLCGESDSENAKLRIENKKLQEEIKLIKPVNIEQYEQIVQLQDKLFAMQHTIDNQENAIFHLKDTDDNLRKKNIKIEELSKVVYNLKMVLSNNDEQVAKIVNEQQATISKLEEEKGYWKSKAMTLLMQVRRLIPRMSAKEVIEFGKELEE